LIRNVVPSDDRGRNGQRSNTSRRVENDSTNSYSVREVS
jgi:hypothetical protein